MRDSEDQLQLIIDTIPSLVWTARPDGFCDFLNQRWLHYTGMTAAQAHGWGWADAIHPDDHKGVVEYWQLCLASGTPVATQARIRRFDGSYRWFLVAANPLRDESGNIVRWYGTNTDIDDRKQAEATLRIRELSWRQIVDNIPGFVNTAGATGAPEFFNRPEQEYFGKTNEELKEWGRIDVIHPEDRLSVIEAWTTSLETGQILEIEARLRRADGVYRWFQMRAVPARDAEGKIRDWYALHTDIEDRKRAERELQRSEAFLAEGQRLSRTGSFSWCIETGEITWSEELYRIFEFDQDLPVTLERIASRVYPDDIPLMQDMIERSRRAASDFEYKHRLLMPDQSVKHVHSFAHATRDQHGRLEYVGATQDVTRQEEERLRRENVRLEERTRIAQELHDTLLQTFLSASMQLDIALDVLPAESSAKPLLNRILEIMRRGIEEGRSSIKGLRSSESGATELVKALTGVQQELPVRQDIDFCVRVAGRQQTLSPLVEQETYRIGREALLNALSHSGAARVECELEYADHCLQMRIRDDGIGIDPQVLNSGREGHWGLAGMRERAARLGGSLTISSSATAGTEVRFSVPSSIAFQISKMGKSA
jgi:PAS domain S-box-containing protein